MNQDTAIVIIGVIVFLSMAVMLRGWPTFIKIERHYHYGKKVKPPKQSKTVQDPPIAHAWYTYKTKSTK